MKKDKKILQLTISIVGIEPIIWRRFLVEDSITFQKLHTTIQKVMGWENYHMYEFRIGDEAITVEEDGYNLAESSFNKLFKSPEFMKMLEQNGPKEGFFALDTNKMNKMLKDIEKKTPNNKFDINTKISQLINSEKQEFTYLYDFGDGWEHSVIVEKVMEKDSTQKYPQCIEGARACPPEDCGGTHGYEELMKIRQNKNHPEYKEKIIEWLGEDYNPELFILDWINARLSGKRPAPVWMPKQETIEKRRKLGRNEPCHCGSGKKYKKCCLDKDIEKYSKAIKVDY